MPYVSRRKRFHKKKGRRREPKTKCPADSEFSVPLDVNDGIDDDTPICSPSTASPAQVSSDHEYFKSCSSLSMTSTDGETDWSVKLEQKNIPPSPSRFTVEELLFQVKRKLDLFLPYRWESTVDKNVLHVYFMSIYKTVTVQRSVSITCNGDVDLQIHGQPVDVRPFLPTVDPAMPLDEYSVNAYVDRMATIVDNVRKMEICGGFDEVRYRHVWSSCPFGEIDKNLFQECRYIETFRSPMCKRLVGGRKWRCSECMKLYGPLRRRAKAASEEERHPSTANKFLTESQLLRKLEEQRTAIDNLKKKNYRLQERVQDIIKKNGVKIDEEMSDDLFEIMQQSEKTSAAQSIFLQQQIKASQQKNGCGMRWHPTMVRFALSLHITSPSAYELVRQTGMVKLPSRRTLFDYSHVKAVSEGIDKTVLESVVGRVQKFSEEHKKYFVLMADEMHISQNLVFQKSTGRMLGYTTLDGVEQEVRNLEQIIDDVNKEVEETVASKVLVFMVKGVSNGVKEVIATYAVSNLSANQLYIWTWQVIGSLERSGIAVIAFISDGSAVNRAFIRKHTPATNHPSGITFDTWNKAARGRKLFFVADVPHLLKTLRNCLLNSRWDGRKSRRKMRKNGKKSPGILLFNCTN